MSKKTITEYKTLYSIDFGAEITGFIEKLQELRKEGWQNIDLIYNKDDSYIEIQLSRNIIKTKSKK